MKKNVSNLIKLLSLAMIVAFVMPETVKAQGSRADFSGTWTLNESKSTIPEEGVELGGRMMGREFTAVQEANLLTRTSKGRDGTERTSKYTLDGTESVNRMGDTESKSVATWSADGKTLTIKTTMEFNFEKRLIPLIWSRPDEKTLSIVITGTGRDGTEKKMTMVYDKK